MYSFVAVKYHPVLLSGPILHGKYLARRIGAPWSSEETGENTRKVCFFLNILSLDVSYFLFFGSCLSVSLL